MSLSVSIESKIRTGNMWGTAVGLELVNVSKIGKLFKTDSKLPIEKIIQDQLKFNHLHDCETFFVSEDIGFLLTREALEIPDSVLQRWDVPSSSGWVYFEKAIHVLDKYPDYEIKAIWWSSKLSRNNIVLTIIAYLNELSSTGALYPCAVLEWGFGHNITDVPVVSIRNENEPSDDILLEGREVVVLVRRYLFAFLCFIKQKITSVVREKIQDRNARRRIEAETKTKDPEVTVIRLRALDQRKHYEQEESEPYPWKHKWRVRAHWRLQYHGPGKPREMIRISSYVKGDLSKPWMPEKVYLVNR